VVRNSLEKQLGKFLRAKRGDRTFAEFSRKTGLPPSTLYRLERGEQSITLRTLQQVLKRLGAKMRDAFSDEFGSK
jgi:transcriptional regulator with XRE-family HTH domain